MHKLKFKKQGVKLHFFNNFVFLFFSAKKYLIRNRMNRIDSSLLEHDSNETSLVDDETLNPTNECKESNTLARAITLLFNAWFVTPLVVIFW